NPLRFGQRLFIRVHADDYGAAIGRSLPFQNVRYPVGVVAFSTSETDENAVSAQVRRPEISGQFHFISAEQLGKIHAAETGFAIGEPGKWSAYNPKPVSRAQNRSERLQVRNGL